jgi:hypothetical protein
MSQRKPIHRTRNVDVRKNYANFRVQFEHADSFVFDDEDPRLCRRAELAPRAHQPLRGHSFRINIAKHPARWRTELLKNLSGRYLGRDFDVV